MKSIFLITVLGSLLIVVSLSHAQDTPVSLSELQKELQAGAEKVGQPIKPQQKKIEIMRATA